VAACLPNYRQRRTIGVVAASSAVPGRHLRPEMQRSPLERSLPPQQIVRRLGTSDLMITPIGLGTAAIGGGDWVLGWGPQDDAQSIATVRRAIDLGINWIDTAAVFGLGHAETIVARALRSIPGGRRPHVFARCGLVWDELGNVSHDLSGPSLRAQAEASLRRLKLDCIDLYQIGWAAWPAGCPADPFASVEQAWETMAALQREGKVRFIGVSGCNGPQLARLQRIAAVTSLSVPYSLLRRELEHCARPLWMDERIAILACSTLGSGLLTGTLTKERVARLPYNDWRRRHAFLQELAVTRASTLVERLRVVSSRRGVSPAAVAVAWALRHPAVTAAVVGARRPQQVEEIVQALSFQLDEDDVETLTRGKTTTRTEPRNPGTAEPITVLPPS
jgi:aryl-alcohol dehydrogenase-like predicted oxidoreductase